MKVHVGRKLKKVGVDKVNKYEVMKHFNFSKFVELFIFLSPNSYVVSIKSVVLENV